MLLSIFSLTSVAQPRYDMSVLKRENLNRGLVAIRENGKVYLSWRTLSSDAVGEKFEVCRNGIKLNKKPLKKGGTFFVDESPLATNAVYEVKGGGKDGRFELKADAPEGYLSIPIQKPEGGVSPDGFRHHEQSLRMVDVLEKNGAGLNLTWEVRDGIVKHQMNTIPATLEGQIVRLSDKIAYIHHDMDDAIRGGILTDDDVPEEIAKVVGRTLGQRLDRFIHDIITASHEKAEIRMSEEVEQAFHKMRAFMFERVYTNPKAKAEEYRAENMVEVLYEYYTRHSWELPELQKNMIENGTPLHTAVCDYISSMTDRYAIKTFESLYVPRTWNVI